MKKDCLFKILKNFFITIFFYFYLFTQVFASILIYEVFPNTVDDKNLEYIQLYNPGSENISLDWYYLQDKSWKIYNFWTWEILNLKEKKKYYRTQTKIILNNTDEEIYLYNSWSLVDNFSYNISEKWEKITRDIWWQENSNTWTIEILINTWSIETSTWETLSWVIDTSSWNIINNSWSLDFLTWCIDTNTWMIINSWVLDIPNIDIEVQSWLEYLTGNIWQCKKEECKINLNLEKVFTWVYEKNNYNCLWGFWSWWLYKTGATEKCNPWYVDYGSWIFNLEAKIYEKWNETNYKIWWLIIKNDFWKIKQEETNSWIIDTNSWETDTESWGLDLWSWSLESSGTILEVPEIVWSFQNPSYLLEKNIIKQNYSCDRTKRECKINLDLRNSFSWSLKESDFICNIDFWFWTWNLTGEENKCNPNTIIYSIWNYNIKFKMISKTNTWAFSTWSIKIENKWYIKPITKHNSWWGWWNIINFININKPEIIIQSWLEKVNSKYKCKKEVCKINLKYEINNPKERCLWSFDWWNYIKSTIEKCNPWYLDYSYGNFKIKLKVYQKDKKSNFKENELKFYNKKNENEDIVLEKKDNNNNKKEIYILLQWKKVNYKEKKEDTIICTGISKCNINLISKIKGYKKKKDLIYNWDFWNWEKSYKANPLWIWFNTGEYDVILKVYENNKFFWEKKLHISIFWEFLKEGKEEQINYNYNNLKIFKVLPNPRWSDSKERIEIKNNSNYIINLKWCELDDDIWKWSKSYKIKKDFFIKSQKTKRIYKTFSKLNLNNIWDSVNLFCNSKLIDSLSWDFKVKDGYYLNHERLFKWKIKAYVIRVIDWDTILVKLSNFEKIKIRLIWVDTPENNKYKKYYEKYWKQASLFTKKYLEGKNIIIENDVDNVMDIYWRRLAYVYVDWVNFNKLLLEKGIAKPYFRFLFKYEEDFKLAYKKAKKQKIWIWQNKEFKKIVLKEIKKDILEKQDKEEIIKIEDKNNNNIPDEFEEIDYKENWNWNILEKIDKKKSFLNYNLFIKKTFYQRIRQTKNWLKVYWETIPFTQVSFFLNWSWENISILSDKYWKYEFLIKSLKEKWIYLPKTVLLDKLWNEFIIRSKKEIIIDKQYLKLLKTKKIKKNKIKKKKHYKKKKSKRKVIQNKTKNKEKIINLIIPETKAQYNYSSEEDINVIYVFLLMIISLILTGILFKKRGLI